MTRTDANQANSDLVTLIRMEIMVRGRGDRSTSETWLRITRDRFSGLIVSIETLVAGEASPKRVWTSQDKGSKR